MGRQIDQRPLLRERENAGERAAADIRIGADAVNRPRQEQALVVACVAREQERRIAADHHRHVVRCVARRRDDQDVAAPRQRHGFFKRAERPPLEADEFRLPPFRPAVRQIALQPSGDSAGALELSSRDPHAASGDVRQPARMVGVEVREHHLPDIAGVDAASAQLRAELLFGMHGEACGASVERVPARVISALVDPRGFPRVHDDDPLVVLDGPGVDRQPVGPFLVEQHVGEARQPAAPRFHLWPPHLYQPGADGVDFRHVLLSLRLKRSSLSPLLAIANSWCKIFYGRAILVNSASSASDSARVGCLNSPK